MGDSGLTDLAGFLLKLKKAEMNMGAQKSGPTLKRVQRSPNKFSSRKDCIGSYCYFTLYHVDFFSVIQESSGLLF